jgi:hypothetical protein
MKKTYALVDCRISEKCKRELSRCGFSVISLPPMKGLPSPIASHTDILTFYIDKTLFISEKYAEEHPEIYEMQKRELTGIDIRTTKEYQKEVYPTDALFNGLVLGNHLFCRRDSFSREIIEFAESRGYTTVNVKQGYPACTVLKISENAAITADRGMAKALSDNGITVTLIENGSISLPPYEYGFIGGAGAAFGDKVYFLGDITSHPSYCKISDAISKCSKHPHFLSDEGLADLGGITFI